MIQGKKKPVILSTEGFDEANFAENKVDCSIDEVKRRLKGTLHNFIIWGICFALLCFSFLLYFFVMKMPVTLGMGAAILLLVSCALLSIFCSVFLVLYSIKETRESVYTLLGEYNYVLGKKKLDTNVIDFSDTTDSFLYYLLEKYGKRRRAWSHSLTPTYYNLRVAKIGLIASAITAIGCIVVAIINAFSTLNISSQDITPVFESLDINTQVWCLSLVVIIIAIIYLVDLINQITKRQPEYKFMLQASNYAEKMLEKRLNN